MVFTSNRERSWGAVFSPPHIKERMDKKMKNLNLPTLRVNALGYVSNFDLILPKRTPVTAISAISVKVDEGAEIVSYAVQTRVGENSINIHAVSIEHLSENLDAVFSFKKLGDIEVSLHWSVNPDDINAPITLYRANIQEQSVLVLENEDENN